MLVDLKRLSIEYNDYPTKYILQSSKEFLTNDKDILFIHIREISEIEKIKKLLDAETLLLSNPRVKKITSNSSDANVDNYNYDIHIENSGTLEELEQKAIEFIKVGKIK